jgi:hypothetical protein
VEILFSVSGSTPSYAADKPIAGRQPLFALLHAQRQNQDEEREPPQQREKS